MATTAEALSFGLLLFPRLTRSDLTGYREVFACTPSARVHLIWETQASVTHDGRSCPG